MRRIPYLRSFDLANITFLVLISVISLVCMNRIPEWRWIVPINTLLILFIFFIARRFSAAPKSSPLRWLRDWYTVAVIVWVFKAIYFMVFPIRGVDYDGILIDIDLWLFGVNPTEWMAQFAHPVLTEILQIVYASYYFLFLVTGYELYRNGRMREFYYLMFLVAYGFYLSYLGYFAVPAIGPRFTIHDYHTMHETLPGIYFTDTIRYLLDAGESIPYGVPNPEDYVQRDVFPSGHTQLTLVLMYAVVLYRMRIRTFILIVGSLLIFSTVYLWYHYVIDIIAGVFFCWLTIYSGRYLHGWWETKRESSQR